MAEHYLYTRFGQKDVQTVYRSIDKIGDTTQKNYRKIQAAARHTSPALKAVDKASRAAQSQMRIMADRAGIAGQALSQVGPAGLAAAAGLGGVYTGGRPCRQ